METRFFWREAVDDFKRWHDRGCAEGGSECLDSTPQPVHYRMMFGAFGGGLKKSFTFVSQAAFDAGIAERLGLTKTVIPVKGTRKLTKADMVHNGATPRMQVDPETYEVRADGELLVCEPAATLPMAQRYFLF